MQQLRNDCQIRILEIYASQEAYQHHIKTQHFQTYKQGTLNMVKSLDLVDMRTYTIASMSVRVPRWTSCMPGCLFWLKQKLTM